MSFLAAPDDGEASAALSPDASLGGAGLSVPPAVPAPALPAAPATAAPLVDPAALQDLGVQLDSPAVAKDFARDYAKMWQQRYSTLASALAGSDEVAALDAVLSLKTSSEMVGGVRLAQLAAELEQAVRGGEMDRASALLRDVAERGSETIDELQFSYVLWDS
ncbi:Hpt domain-containing protein [Arthrobacter sp. UYCu712]|uniref:Hpt domain-containing protein n=1 Tax=Arthrobacter sp. UYCu712 TaxID=3156340 RepID=UPI003392FB93